MLGARGRRVDPALYLLLGVLGVLVFLVVAPLWSAIFGGLIVGYLGRPTYRWLLARVDRPGAAAGLTLTGLSLAVLLPGAYLAYVMVQEATQLARTFTAEDVEAALEGVAELTQTWLGWPATTPETTGAEALAAEILPRLRQVLIGWLPNAATFLVGFLIAATVVAFVAYYTLKDGEALVDFVLDLVPMDPRTEARLLQDVGRSLDAVIFGQVATALVQGALAGIGFWIFGVPSPVLLGFVSAVLSILPAIGPFLVWLPAGVYLLAEGRTGAAVGMLAWGALVVSTADHVIRATVISTRGDMHPTVALVGVIGGFVAFGVMGFILGPVVLALFVTLLRIYLEQRPSPREADRVERVLEHLGRIDPATREAGEASGEREDEGAPA